MVLTWVVELTPVTAVPSPPHQHVYLLLLHVRNLLIWPHAIFILVIKQASLRFPMVILTSGLHTQSDNIKPPHAITHYEM